MASVAQTRLLQELDDVRTQIANIEKTAQELGVTGSYQLKFPELKILYAREAHLKHRALRCGGAPSRSGTRYISS